MTEAQIRQKIRVADALEALLASGAPVILHRPPRVNAAPCYSGSAGTGWTQRHGEAFDLHALLNDLAPEPERKLCLRCGETAGPKRLSAFRQSGRTLDGRHALCAACEVERHQDQDQDHHETNGKRSDHEQR